MTEQWEPVRSEDMAQIILAFANVREAYFDPENASDGPFTALLTLFRFRSEELGVEAPILLDAVTSRLSTAEYVIERLIDSGYIEHLRVSEGNRYRLSLAMERNIESYLNECASLIDRMVLPTFRSSSGKTSPAEG